MPLTTCDVTVTINDQAGDPVEGATVTAELDTWDVDSGLVMPDPQTGSTNASGQLTLAMWPNSLGGLGSGYRVTVRRPDGSKQAYTVEVPNTASANFEDLVGAAGSATASSALLHRALASATAFGALSSLSADTLGFVQTTGDRYFYDTSRSVFERVTTTPAGSYVDIRSHGAIPGTGHENTAALQAAFTAAATAGVPVYVPPGDWYYAPTSASLTLTAPIIFHPAARLRVTYSAAPSAVASHPVIPL